MVNKSKHGKQERFGVTIQLVIGDDNDLIAAIAKLPERGRQAILKMWLRESQGFKTVAKNKAFGAPDHSEAIQYLINKVEWVEGQMSALHPYLEDKFANVTMKTMPMFGSAPQAPQETEQERASREALERRANRIGKGKWS